MNSYYPHRLLPHRAWRWTAHKDDPDTLVEERVWVWSWTIRNVGFFISDTSLFRCFWTGIAYALGFKTKWEV